MCVCGGGGELELRGLSEVSQGQTEGGGKRERESERAREREREREREGGVIDISMYAFLHPALSQTLVLFLFRLLRHLHYIF